MWYTDIEYTCMYCVLVYVCIYVICIYTYLYVPACVDMYVGIYVCKRHTHVNRFVCRTVSLQVLQSHV